MGYAWHYTRTAAEQARIRVPDLGVDVRAATVPEAEAKAEAAVAAVLAPLRDAERLVRLAVAAAQADGDAALNGLRASPPSATDEGREQIEAQITTHALTVERAVAEARQRLPSWPPAVAPKVRIERPKGRPLAVTDLPVDAEAE